jgi:hypothetical protein
MGDAKGAATSFSTRRRQRCGVFPRVYLAIQVAVGTAACFGIVGCAATRPVFAGYSPVPPGLSVIPANLAYDDSVQSIPAEEFEALAIRVELIDQRKVVASGVVRRNDAYKRADLGIVPVGRYHLRVTAKCHPSVDDQVVVDEGTLGVDWRLPPADEVRFVSEATEVRRVGRQGQNEGNAQVPKSAKVRVLHRMPDQSGACTSALAEVIGDAPPGLGGRFIVAETRLAFRSPAEVEAEQEIAARGREAVAAEKASQETQREEAKIAEKKKREEALAAGAAEELKNGRCRQDRYKLLQAAGELTVRYLGPNLSVEDRVMGVAETKGSVVRLKAGLGGKYHLFVVGVEPVTMSVRDRQGYDVDFKSPHEFEGGSLAGALSTQLRTQVWTTSRVLLQVETRETIAVTVKGRGCVGVLAVRE